MSESSLERFARHKLRSLERRQLQRALATSDRGAAATIERDGERLVSFACNDYLGLANDPVTRAAAIAATESLGTGAGASRLITGSHSLYRELEQKLAALKATDDAVVFGSGYLANLGLIPLLCGKPDLILLDALAHSSLRTGAIVSGATRLEFPHNDAAAADALLAAHRHRHRHCLILTEGVFSMDGDLAPLPALAELAGRHDTWLMTDDAHGLGVVGDGRGSDFAFTPLPEVPLKMGTLSKAVGAYGGYLCASHAVCELVRNRARSFVYSTGLPPGTVAAAAAAVDLIARDPDRVARPLAFARRFCAALELPAANSAIVPLVFGGNRETLAASDALRQAGYFVAAIRPPTVPTGTARLRFTFTAAHRDADVDGLISAVQRLLRERRRMAAQGLPA